MCGCGRMGGREGGQVGGQVCVSASTGCPCGALERPFVSVHPLVLMRVFTRMCDSRAPGYGKRRCLWPRSRGRVRKLGDKV